MSAVALLENGSVGPVKRAAKQSVPLDDQIASKTSLLAWLLNLTLIALGGVLWLFARRMGWQWDSWEAILSGVAWLALWIKSQHTMERQAWLIKVALERWDNALAELNEKEDELRRTKKALETVASRDGI